MSADGLARLPGAVVASPAAFALAPAYIVLVLAGTMWGAFRLPPATMSSLLSVEILSGVGSATLILGERFGPVQAAGAVCIIGAALVEVLESRAAPPRPA